MLTRGISHPHLRWYKHGGTKERGGGMAREKKDGVIIIIIDGGSGDRTLTPMREIVR